MDSKVIYFTVCRYVPDILRDEFINVGVLAHIPQDEWCYFYKTKNLVRIKHFDDEVELDVISVLLESLEYQFNEVDLLSPNHEGIAQKNFLENELRYFVNQLQFSEIRTLVSTEPEKDIADLRDLYLYYDKKKSERINTDRVRRLVSKLFTSSDLKKSITRNPEPQNLFKQQPFDFSMNLNGDEVFIKALSFDYKHYNKLFNEVKGLLYDIEYFKKNNIHHIKLVVNNTEFKEEFEKLALEQLKNVVDVYTLEEFANFVSKAEVARQDALQ
ncbi:DUF3037 domain-containing protein [Anaerobacillus sp. MEB173]|uniref:DUF3037 domain-containing protein n=1 Tax=Anaerobacillus sp. MEB173 TaxID=3383345 RepID=UPI003F8DACB9